MIQYFNQKIMKKRSCSECTWISPASPDPLCWRSADWCWTRGWRCSLHWHRRYNSNGRCRNRCSICGHPCGRQTVISCRKSVQLLWLDDGLPSKQNWEKIFRFNKVLNAHNMQITVKALHFLWCFSLHNENNLQHYNCLRTIFFISHF